MSGLPCPNCGSETTFLEQYHRHYCYSCGRYAPEGYGDRGAKTCPTCGGILSFVEAYARYYCYRCNAYPPEEEKAAPKEAQPAVAEPPVVAASPEPTMMETAKPEEIAQPEAAPTTTVETSADVVGEPADAETPSEEEPASEKIAEEAEEPSPKPPLVRKVIWQAKKPVLLDLCKAYGLDPTGTKEQLRERLLSYLDELEPESRPEEEEAQPEEEPAEVEEVETSEEPPQLAEETEPLHESGVSEGLSEQEPTEMTDSSLETSTPRTTTTQETDVERSVPQTVRAAEPVVIVPETPAVREVTEVEHPCPTCNRELTYIPQYNRWYCYSCRAYAPLARSRNACPNCGATLRWIDRYERWWCDACRRYAPADLPRPERAAVSAAATVTAARAVETTAYRPAAVVVHRHRSPGGGIGLMTLGLVLFVLYEAFVDLPAVLTVNTGILLAPDVAWGLRFFAFVFVAGGAILGLSSVRDRR